LLDNLSAVHFLKGGDSIGKIYEAYNLTQAGQKAKPGIYVCVSCADKCVEQCYMVPEQVKVLPVCPKCGGKTYMKVD